MRPFLFLLCLLLMNPAFAEDLVLEEIPLEAPQLKVPPLSSDNTNVPIKTQSLDDLYSQIDAQAKNLKEFTERIEQLEHNLKLAEDKLERINQDISFRLSELENKQSPEPVILDKKSDQERYDYAYSLLDKKNYKQAEKEFLSFISDFPSSNLLPNAIYWLAETYYVQGQNEQAVGRFADVFTKYPQSNKAPDALLKMGLTMVALQKTTEACTAFLALPDEYPQAKDTLKQRAKEEAQKNKCS